MTGLTYLDLSTNQLSGTIPDQAFGNMTAFEYLDLGHNILEGEIPIFIWGVSTLHTLRLDSNRLQGRLSEASFPQLKQLEELDLSRNSFQGELSEALFSNLSELQYLDLSFNSLSLNIHDSDWIPPFRLAYILLGSCKLGRQFPKWLQTQKNYSALDISNSGISDSIPNWFWDLSKRFTYMNLSHNQMTGEVGNVSLEVQPFSVIDLSSNQLEGPVPTFMFKMVEANLSRNRFSKLNLLCNITGHAPLEYLDVSNNELSGELPDCWWHFEELVFLLLTNNNLSGNIPNSIGLLTMLQTLQLSSNNFVGELPSALRNCTRLQFMDFEGNKLSGSVLTWMGENLHGLSIVSLRSNSFTGSIPWNMCHLACLKILDLSLNDISGGIPACLGTFTSMRSWDTDHCRPLYSRSLETKRGRGEYISNTYEAKLQLQWKGKLMEFEKILENNLGGQIPSSLTVIDRLSTLDLSNNNLSRKIPTSTQLQSFANTSYVGNPELCGPPLPNKCPGDQEAVPEQTASVTTTEDADGILSQGFYISMAIGFAIAFWGVSGTLIFNKSSVGIKMSKLLRKITN
ncbi:hypothetical protein TIFTF001_019837 [Ficus carica]|uniref:Uncharacterized protein n=1 Tax=Ficus carica TaxID=3494 RepID=A0AA88DC44_FICCA|nr:hypothetical protein TIFTF001_019837 [Ficus carica]